MKGRELMGMYFVFESSIEKAMYKKAEFIIEDEMDYFIGEIKEYIDVISKGSADVLLSIDPYGDIVLSNEHPYGDIVLSNEQVEKLLILGKSMIDEELIEHLKYLKLFKRYNLDEKEYLNFANDLICVCNKAIEENKQIVSLGD